MTFADNTIALLQQICALPLVNEPATGGVATPQAYCLLGPYVLDKAPCTPWRRKPAWRISRKQLLLDYVAKHSFLRGYIQAVLHLNHSRIGGGVGVEHMSAECLLSLIQYVAGFIKKHHMALALCAPDYLAFCEDDLFHEKLFQAMGTDLGMSQGYLALGFSARGLKAGGSALEAAARETPLPNLVLTEDGIIELMAPPQA